SDHDRPRPTPPPREREEPAAPPPVLAAALAPARPAEAPPAATLPAPVPDRAPWPPRPAAQPPWVIWVLLAIILGIGLRFLPLPAAVGLAVAALVTLSLRLGATRGEEDRPSPDPRRPAR